MRATAGQREKKRFGGLFETELYGKSTDQTNAATAREMVEKRRSYSLWIRKGCSTAEEEQSLEKWVRFGKVSQWCP